ncbi:MULTISPECIES: RNA 3'-terminal phosphate cyclase [unclassified Coleofasciculus]|uniref:RNA 3'-terminal phosphate cyclase n=1 Tax=unclassified Coleofasciculus TaxID=2692782 RepID=UPI00187FC056|nr:MULTISPECIES: RNA 3'-terminal phosphate cyclase [unclassified Coleofasciculus]MBE9125061.1 RNA 3'-terminal phosphate cyclase [Coleofasciculus sp. LEGE 07081]MBE9151287.1 RNA 3'-terminal phosphate cyclase [Coleofasciculus sp. LEGE 07092]
MIDINGSYGEGGGQVLRTSLSLAAITGQPIRINRIRAGRKKPGLAAQHLTAVRAVAAICQAQVQGDELGSTTLEFIPGCPPQAGDYTFDVTQTKEGGSAGAVMLILQTILLPLALATGDSVVTLKGGTHVSWSPPTTYIEHVYLPFLRQLDVQAQVQLRAWGWYPQGGGEVELQVTGNGGGVSSRLGSLHLLERGALQQVWGLAVVTNLPSHIPQRMASRAENLLQQANLKGRVQPLRERGIAPGAGIFLIAEYEHSRAGFSALGRVGLPAERVAEMAFEELMDFHTSEKAVDPFLADQLLLPTALGSQVSQYQVAEISTHLTTNAWTIEQFGLAEVEIDEDRRLVTVKPVMS